MTAYDRWKTASPPDWDEPEPADPEQESLYASCPPGDEDWRYWQDEISEVFDDQH